MKRTASRAIDSNPKRSRSLIKKGKALLRKTDFKGDIVPRNLHLYSAGVVKPGAVTRVKTRWQTNAVNGGTTSGQFFAQYFTLSALTNVADYTNVFDQYRITCAEITFSPFFNQYPLTSSTTPGRLYTVIDYDDAGTPASLVDLLTYPNCVMTQPWEKVTRTLVPHCAQSAYNGSFAGYVNVKSPWIDTVSNSVQHYGVKGYVEASTTTGSQWHVDAIIYIEFRNQRTL